MQETCNLLTDLARLGCRIVLKDGKPRIVGDVQKVHPNALDALIAHKDEIVSWLTRREWRCFGGHVFAETWWDEWWGTDRTPDNAEFERRMGERDWRRIKESSHGLVAPDHPTVSRPTVVQREFKVDRDLPGSR